jgi:hypothetical protein
MHRWEGPLKYSDLIQLLERNQSSADWIKVENENGDGGNTSFCLEDVLLVIKFDVVWKGGKPIMRFQISYDSTRLAWFDIPVLAVDQRPLTHSEILAHIQASVAQ